MARRLARLHDELRAGEPQAQHLRICDGRDVDGPPRIERQAGKLRYRLALDLLDGLARRGEREIRGRGRGARLRDGLLEGAPLEVMPEAPQARARALELPQALGLLRRQPLRLAQPLLGGLPLGELTTVVLGEMLAPLALILLGGELRHEALEQLVPGLPEPAQLIEYQRRERRLGETEPALERTQHFLHSLRGTLLLLDAILQAIDLLLQLPVRLLQLRTVAKQSEHAMVFLRGLFAAEIELEVSELSKRLHETNGGGPPDLSRRR